MATQDSRIRIKRSTTPGVTPTIPASSNHLDGSWLSTDLYVGEFMTNVADERVWFRASAGLVELQTASNNVLNVNTTPVGNTGGGTDNLQQYTVPAGKLAADGDFLDVDVSGTLRTDGSVTSINFLFGGMGLFATGGAAIAIPNTGGTSSVFRIRTKIVRLSDTTQFAFTTLSFTDGAGAVVVVEMQTVGTETLSGAIVLKMQATATNDNDVVQAVTIVKYN